MSLKETLLERIGEMPEDASPKLVREQIDLILAVHEAIASADAGRVIPLEEAKATVATWFGK